MGTVACCSRLPCCNICLSCTCWRCCLDTYLHLYIRSIELQDKLMSSADVNISGTGDVYCEVIWGDWRQITTVQAKERGGVTETEPIILENASPTDARANGTLILQIWDYDGTTGDDFLCAAQLKPHSPNDHNIPLYYGQNVGETRLELWTNPTGEREKGNHVGYITLDQIHFIQQKLMPYRGCKGQCCCCDESQPVCCCIETAKSLTKRARDENKKLMADQQALGQKNAEAARSSSDN